MDWISQAISEYGQAIGLPDLALDEQHNLNLALENDEVLGIRHLADPTAGEVLVSCARPLGWNRPDLLRRALRLVDFRNLSHWPVQVALDQQRLLFNLRVPERSFVHNVLEQAVAQLRQMHDKLG